MPALLGCFLLIGGAASAHPDLQSQIDRLTQELVLDPHNIDLIIRRGDLYRRHGDWADAECDFQQVRSLEPDNTTIDWYEGRLMVEAGRPDEGDLLLTRFLASNPDHAGAYRVRAQARLSLGQPLLAAADFQSAINAGDNPSPALYRSLVLAWVAAGTTHSNDALGAAQTGLDRYPREVTLLGLATDLSLAQSDTRLAESYVSSLPQPLTELPQWLFRRALRLCIDGDDLEASELFDGMLESETGASERRTGTWPFPESLVRELAADAAAEKCRVASWKNLTSQ